ncbi:MAG: metal-dependent hydrolase [Nanoarchaeota archaeon]|nr:metal-dependent hydrolase [Nanoarchaeota archaeon]
MRWYTHTVFGLLVAILLKFNLIMVLVCVFASLVPDIDTTKSKLGRKVKPLSWFFNVLFGHRKLFHGLFFAAGLSFLIYLYSFELALAFFVGYLSHLVIDSFNFAGIRWFYPAKFKIKGFIKTGSFLEHILFFVILIFIAILSF